MRNLSGPNPEWDLSLGAFASKDVAPASGGGELELLVEHPFNAAADTQTAIVAHSAISLRRADHGPIASPGANYLDYETAMGNQGTMDVGPKLTVTWQEVVSFAHRLEEAAHRNNVAR